MVPAVAMNAPREPVPALVRKFRVSSGTSAPALDKGLWPTRASASTDRAPNAAPSIAGFLPVADKAAIDPNDEGMLIAALDRLGYLYYNSFDHEPDGSATIRAILRSTGELRTLHVETTGSIGVESGWKQ